MYLDLENVRWSYSAWLVGCITSLPILSFPLWRKNIREDEQRHLCCLHVCKVDETMRIECLISPEVMMGFFLGSAQRQRRQGTSTRCTSLLKEDGHKQTGRNLGERGGK